MRIRKHLSGLNLPAVCNPVFRSSSSEEMIKVLPSGGSGTGASEAETPAAGASSASSSQELELAAVGLEKKILKCRTGVLKVYTSSSRSTPNTSSSSAAAAGSGQHHNGPGAAPTTPTPLATRPRRTKPNACLSKGSSYKDGFCMQHQQAVPITEEDVQQQQPEAEHHRRLPLVEHIFPVIQDVSSINPSPAPLEVSMETEEIPIERDLLLPLSKSQLHDGRHQDVGVAQRTRSMRNLEEVVDLNNNDDDNQCRRRDGKGWRCHRKTQPAYSLCEYHLDKSRETHQRKLKNSGASSGEPKRKYVRRKPVKARSLMSI